MEGRAVAVSETTAQTKRKTFKYKLKPTPEQEQALERVLWRCRTLYSTGLEQRITRSTANAVSPSHSMRKRLN